MSAGPTLLYGLRAVEMMLVFFSEGFEERHWTARPGGELHSARWILAHLVHSLHKEAGSAAMPLGLDARFGYGAPPEDDHAGWPSPAELLAEWPKAVAACSAAWAARGEADWAAAVEANPRGVADRAQAAQFQLQHASYHVGQLGAIRRLLGLPGRV